MIDIKALAAKADAIEVTAAMTDDLLPDIVPERVLNIDGDSACYECAGNDNQPLTTSKRRFKQYIADKMALAGAEFAYVCLTGGDHTKGGRYAIARTQAYQEKRIGSVKPVNLSALRAWVYEEYQQGFVDIQDLLAGDKDAMVTSNNPIIVVDTSEEADDAMTQIQHMHIYDLNVPELSVICAEDKDLFMNEGNFMDWNTGEITEVYGYGYIEPYTTPGGTNKIIGRGRAFFFAQLLMGDSADNIPGLPYFAPHLVVKYWPTSDMKEMTRRLSEQTMPSGKECTPRQLEAAGEKLNKLTHAGRTKQCGPVAVYEYLADVTTEKQAFMKVLEAYCSYYGKDEKVGDECWQPIDFLLEQARLLWMRRHYGEDVLDYFREINKNG